MYMITRSKESEVGGLSPTPAQTTLSSIPAQCLLSLPHYGSYYNSHCSTVLSLSLLLMLLKEVLRLPSGLNISKSTASWERLPPSWVMKEEAGAPKGLTGGSSAPDVSCLTTATGGRHGRVDSERTVVKGWEEA